MAYRLHRDDVLNMNSQLIQSLGFGPIGEIHYLAKSTGNTYARLTKQVDRQLVPDEFLHTLGPYHFHNAATTYENDVLAVAPDSHLWYGSASAGGSLTWSKSCTHMVGMAPFSKGGGMRSRFGHSGYTMASFFTISGHNNLFKNLYWMHGSSTGGASDVEIGRLSGARNVFEQCHFAGPNDQTQASAAAYNTIEEDGTQNYFKDCLFGGMNAIHRDAANTVLRIGGGQGTVYENCVFWSRTAATTPYFINVDATVTGGSWLGIFLNCQFINMTPLHGSYDMAVAITATPGESDENYLFFDNRCTFAGVTDIIADAKEEMIVWGGAGANPDSAAIGDDINLGLAQYVNHT